MSTKHIDAEISDSESDEPAPKRKVKITKSSSVDFNRLDNDLRTVGTLIKPANQPKTVVLVKSKTVKKPKPALYDTIDSVIKQTSSTNPQSNEVFGSPWLNAVFEAAQNEPDNYQEEIIDRESAAVVVATGRVS